MSSLPTLRQIQFLLALKKHGNFRIAAEHCNVTQSTLSAGIAEMENLLGAPVIDRSIRRKVRFTILGEELLVQGKQAIEALTEVAEHARQQRQPLSSPLRLGIIPTIAPYLLPKILRPLRKKFPELMLHIHELQSSILVTQIREGQLDAGIIALPFETHDLNTQTLAEEDFFVVLPQAQAADLSSITLNNIDPRQLLVLADGHCLRDHTLQACNLKGDSRPQDVSATSLPTLIQLVSEGYGMTLLPEMVIRDGTLPTGLTVLPITPIPPKRTIGMVWRNKSPRGHDINLLTEAVLKMIQHD